MNTSRQSFRCIVMALVTFVVSPFAEAATLYVWPDSPSSASPYADWSTAAHDIQTAINAAVGFDTVLVTNGIYATDGKVMVGDMTNRVALDKIVTVQSVNGRVF